MPKEAGGMDCYYLGYNKDMAETYIEDCAKWAKSFDLMAGTVTQRIIKDPDKDILVFRVRFASGHKVVALSSKPANLRSRKGRFILDEFAFHDRQAELRKAVMATLIWGGRVSIISTHNGDSCDYFEICEEIRSGKLDYSLHRTTIDDAIADGLCKRIFALQGLEWSIEAQEAWRSGIFADYGISANEELLCIPGSYSGTLAFNHFSRDRHIQSTEFDYGWPLHLSFDFNRSPATCLIAQECRGHLYVLDELYLLNSDTFELGREARAIVDRLGPILTYIHGDATGRIMTANSQQSNWDIIRTAFVGLPLNWCVKPSNPPVVDTLNDCNNAFALDRVSIDPRCKELIKDCGNMRLTDKGELDKKRDLMRGHLLDTMRYLTHDVMPYRDRNGTVGVTAIVGGMFHDWTAPTKTAATHRFQKGGF